MLFLFLGACLTFACCDAESSGFTYPIDIREVQGPYELVALDPDGLLLGVNVIDLHVPHAIAPQHAVHSDVVCRPVEYAAALGHVAASQG